MVQHGLGTMEEYPFSSSGDAKNSDVADEPEANNYPSVPEGTLELNPGSGGPKYFVKVKGVPNEILVRASTIPRIWHIYENIDGLRVRLERRMNTSFAKKVTLIDDSASKIHLQPVDVSKVPQVPFLNTHSSRSAS